MAIFLLLGQNGAVDRLAKAAAEGGNLRLNHLLLLPSLAFDQTSCTLIRRTISLGLCNATIIFNIKV